jgi:hypothetical protein
VHVDDVRDAPQLVQRGQRFPALETILESDQEEDRGTEKNEIVDGRLGGLDEDRESIDSGGHAHRGRHRDENHCDDTDHEADGASNRPHRAAQIGDETGGLPANREQFARDAGQS